MCHELWQKSMSWRTFEIESEESHSDRCAYKISLADRRKMAYEVPIDVVWSLDRCRIEVPFGIGCDLIWCLLWLDSASIVMRRMPKTVDDCHIIL